MATHEAPRSLIDVVVFEIGGRRFALPVSVVDEVLPSAEPTPLPHVPETVAGVLNVRGEVLPVLDLRPHLGQPTRPVAPSDHLVLVRCEARRVLLHVDRALDLYGIDPERLRPVETTRGPVGSVVALDDGVLLVQDPDRLLDPEGAEVLEAVLREVAQRGGARS